MNILKYRPAMAREVAAAYNRGVRDVPHCYPVSVRDFASALRPAVDGTRGKHRHSEAVFVAAEDDAIIGFIHVAIAPVRRGDKLEQGIIRFFWYEPGRRAAGQELLEAAEEHVRRCGKRTVAAFPQHHIYQFYHLGAAYLSDRLSQVAALLGHNGYTRCAGEVFLDWPNFDAVKPVPANVRAKIVVSRPKGRGVRPGVVVRALQGKREVGVCNCASMGEFSRSRHAQDWIETEWLAVAEKLQGRGLGRYLLQRALWEARRLGYRHAAISTSWQNYRAALFYSNMGYQFVDWTYGLERKLK